MAESIKIFILAFILSFILLTSGCAKLRDIDIPIICGNGICEEGENAFNCPGDCRTTFSNDSHFGADYPASFSSIIKEDATLQGFSDLFTSIGFEIVRLDAYWGLLEPSKGVYNWSFLDKQINYLPPDTEILILLFSTSQWGSDYLDCRREIAEYYDANVSAFYNRYPSSIPVNMDDYLSFLDAIVTRYKDKVKYWQIENEIHGAVGEEEFPAEFPSCPLVSKFWIGTMEEYILLLKESYTKIKSVDPTATVLMSSFMGGDDPNPKFTNYQLKHGLPYTDVIDIHIYGCPEDSPKEIARFKIQAKLMGYDTDIWATEHGEIDISACHTEARYKQSFTSRDELKLQSEEIIKRHVLAHLTGVHKMFFLGLIPGEENPDPENMWYHMALTLDLLGLEKKPSYYTTIIMIEKLKDFTMVEKLDEGVYRFSFEDKNPMYILWSDRSPQFIDLSSYINTAKVLKTQIVTALDAFGNPIYYEDEIISPSMIPVTKTPIFIQAYIE